MLNSTPSSQIGSTAATLSRDSEEGRAFYQARVALFGRASFLLFGALAAIGLSATCLTFTHTNLPPLPAIPLLGMGYVWWRCRRGSVSTRALDAMDCILTVAAGVSLAVVVLIAPKNLAAGVSVGNSRQVLCG